MEKRILAPRVAMPLLALLLVVTSTTTCRAEPPRESWQPPDRIMDAIGVKAGMKIGEAGAGSGYMTFPLAERVGPQGVVFANDISQSGLDEIARRASLEGVGNIRTVLGEIEDPLFPEGQLDMLVMVYVLHCLDRPTQFVENLVQYLSEGASLVIIEHDTHHMRAHPPSFMASSQILETIERTAFTLERTETFLPRDTIYILKVDPGSKTSG